MSLKVGSLFSGCGGFDLGFEKAGFDIAWANDIEPNACETYRKNIGEIIEGDVNSIDPLELQPIDVLSAGFPCQPFSNAGSRKGTSDSRGQLYRSTFKFIEVHNPKVVVYENVRGFLSFKDEDGERLIDNIVKELEARSYDCSYKLVNFSHFGVPQNRIRVILIAVRNDLGNVSSKLFPEIATDVDLSIEATLKGLDDSYPNQNELMKLNPQALHYGAMIPEGGSWKSLPYDVLPDRWKKIRDNMAKYHYPNFFRRYSRNDVMGTITAAFKPENAAVWHPVDGRIFSVREIARFQTFPDDFVFYGKNIKSKYQQIGNAVPPLFSQKLGERIKMFLDSTDVQSLDYKKPISCSFNVNKPMTSKRNQELLSTFGI
ncbi:TPA: DNA cytosine methyltransferase [Vibrio parahaemolyticus]|uniref:DNA cytosine methyltransferase n=1 Tax=Vibrio parahaemolyticus TaxID=670 RepID=UPI00041039BD|nr:DNA cytosine methyltransferase [Vibrio parahaemolyticus]MBE4012685.1 DNA cytosine methyltransferase [Vibrio parahaemolyticus]MDF4750331.1 DNA cytosine methyltransferase [Vibrio parahaemolyticus]HCE2128187.1 DNA cytosine methyltransferase [Vibrio parahaemolyticus]HCE3220895.1 DNA cytosine methyltransferase [Vibrio parahaemolyticus]HCM1038603.1 DNA cytosine methyltransferase [Vibrio parahaemolyticus]